MKQFSFKPAQVFSEYLKIQNIIFTSIQLEVEVLNQHRQFYNPNKFSRQSVGTKIDALWFFHARYTILEQPSNRFIKHDQSDRVTNSFLHT